MIASATSKSVCRNCLTPEWHDEFQRMLPLIHRVAWYSFRHHLAGDDFDDAVQEVVANALVAYTRLVKQGRSQDAKGSPLARYGVAQYWAGRRVGGKLNIRDVMSTHCRRNKGVKFEPLHHWDALEQGWEEVLVEDKSITPADLAASRIDFPAWLATLSSRDRQIAESLGGGESTRRVSKLFGISAARISQLRRELMQSWHSFHQPRDETLVAV